MRTFFDVTQRSIARNLSIGLLTMLLIVSGTGLYLSSRLSASRARAELESKADEYLSSLVESLTLPLWNYDQQTVRSIGKAYEQNEFIAMLRIEGGTNEGILVMNTLFTMEKAAQSSDVSKTRDISYQNTLVGRVALSLTIPYYTTIQRQFFWSYSLSILLMMGVLLIGTNMLLRLLLKQPLQHFTDVVDAYAGGNQDAFEQTMPYIELQPFIAALHTMGKTISAQIEALKQAEHKYRSIFENATEGIFRTSPDGRILDCNPALANILGYDTPEEMITTITSLKEQVYVDGEHQDALLSALQDQRQVTNFEAQLYRKDGSIIWVLMNVRLVTDEAGTVQYYEGLLQDITQRKQAEDALTQSEQKFRILIENAVVGIYIIQEGILVYVNPSLAKTFGYLPEEIIGTLRPQDLIHPDDIPLATRQIQDRLSGTLERTNTLYKGVKKDGTLILIEVYGMRIDYQGRPAIMSTLIDMTERKRAEEALRESEEQYRFLTENIKDVIWIMDVETLRFLYVSPSVKQLRGYTPEEIMAEPMDAALSPEGAVYVRKILADRLAAFTSDENVNSHTRFYTEELEQPCKDGSMVWTEVTTRYYWNDKTGRIEVHGVSRDITERKRTEEELQRHREHLEELVKKRTAALEAKTRELEKFNKAMVNRELRIIEMKEEVNRVCEELGREPKYAPVWRDEL